GARGSLTEHFLQKADLLFSIGSSLFPNRFSHAIPDAAQKTIVQCTVDALDINRSYETHYPLIGDGRLTWQAPSCELASPPGAVGVCYMMGDFEAVARHKIGVTTLHINNGGYSGYGPGFWGPGHDPHTWQVSDHSSACMSSMARSVGWHGEDVSEPSEIIPA